MKHVRTGRKSAQYNPGIVQEADHSDKIASVHFLLDQATDLSIPSEVALS